MITPSTQNYLDAALGQFSPSHASGLAREVMYAMSLHSGQAPRPSGEQYANHVVRVASRIVNDFHIVDQELFITGLLHDVVEDQLDNLCGHPNATREEAYAILESKYSKRVSDAIKGLTNDEYSDPGISREELNDRYAQHVMDACDTNWDCYIVKLSDFFDNAMQLQRNTQAEARIKGARKYLPLFDYFSHKLIDDSTLPIPQRVKVELAAQITTQKAYALQLLQH